MKGTPLARRTPLKRSGPIRSRPRRRPPTDWETLHEAVVRRDVFNVVRHVRALLGVDELKATFSRLRLMVTVLDHGVPIIEEWCVAPVLDPAERGKCSGRWTLNHVQDPSDPMHGRKVPDEMGFLVSLCAWHHQGSEAGHVWATASENIELQWKYLKEQDDGGQRPAAG